MATADRGTTGDAGGTGVAEPAESYMPPVVAEAGPRSALAPAGWWPRVGATLVDQVLLFVLFALGAIVLTIGSVDPFRGTATRLVVLALGLVYATLMLAFHYGQTVGKEVARVRVVAEDGAPVGVGRAFGREVVKAVFGVTVIVWIVDVLWPLWQAENRALHDLVAGTRVVHAPQGPPNDYYPAPADDA